MLVQNVQGETFKSIVLETKKKMKIILSFNDSLLFVYSNINDWKKKMVIHLRKNTRLLV